MYFSKINPIRNFTDEKWLSWNLIAMEVIPCNQLYKVVDSMFIVTELYLAALHDKSKYRYVLNFKMMYTLLNKFRFAECISHF